MKGLSTNLPAEIINQAGKSRQTKKQSHFEGKKEKRGADRTLQMLGRLSCYVAAFLVGGEACWQEAGELRRSRMETSARLRCRLAEMAEELRGAFGDISAGENGCLLEAVEDWAVEVGDQ